MCLKPPQMSCGRSMLAYLLLLELVAKREKGQLVGVEKNIYMRQLRHSVQSEPCHSMFLMDLMSK